MPSLTPQKPLARASEIDLIATFKSEEARASRERVINYLFPLYQEFSDLDVEKAWSKTTQHEEIYLAMPTLAAYRAEIELCNGILEHARGQIGDPVMIVLLTEFLHTHIWIYHPSGPRTNKKGDFTKWARPELYTMYFTPEDRGRGEQSVICNAMQAWFIRLLEEKRGANSFRLEKL